MSTLYVDRRNLELRLEGRALTFYEDGVRVGTVPTAPLERVVFRSAAKVETQALAKLGSLGVGLIFLFGQRREPSLFLPRQHNDAERRVSQCVLSRNSEFTRLAALDIVQAKIDAQLSFLFERAAAIGPSVPAALIAAAAELKSLRRALEGKPSEDSIRGVEGRASRSYFNGLFTLFPASLNFTNRNRQPPRDPVNAVLSLSYVLLYADAALAAHEVGLDPCVGFLHKTDFGRCSLACDLMEPARAMVDRFVWKLFDEGVLHEDHFSTTAAGCFLQKDARALFYPAYEKAASDWRAFLQARARRLADDILHFDKDSLSKKAA